MKKHLAIALSVVLLIGLLSGCTPSVKPPIELDTPKKTSLVSAIGNDPATFDPSLATKGTETFFLNNMFEPLYYVDTAKNSEWIPALAESYEISPDGLLYTFNLRKGVTFHNGDPFTAQDVLFTFIEQCFDSPYRASNFAGLTKEGITAPDDHTIEIRLNAPNAAVMSNLTRISIVPKGYFTTVGTEKFSEAPIGTGPYKLVSYEPGNKISLVATDDYWGGKPQIEQVVVRIIPDNNTIGLEVENGKLDLYSGLNVALYSTLSQNTNLTIEERI